MCKNLIRIFFIFFFSVMTLNFVYAYNFNSKYVSSEMVYIPGDSYSLLFKENNDVVKHAVSSFLLDKKPITNMDFKNFVFLFRKWNPLDIISFFSNKEYLVAWLLNENKILIEDDPVVNVSWYACSAYCKGNGKRLPTIDEWEYVSSATLENSHNKNDFFYVQKVLSWYINTIGKSEYTTKNMFYNYWNVFGLYGIIWEWVYDFNSVIIIGADSEGGDQEQLLFCGAAAENSVNPIDYVGFMRFAFRNSLDSNFSLSSLGFRCAKSIYI